MNWLAQLIIIIGTGLGLFMTSQMNRATRKIGYIFALIGQCGWLYSVHWGEQWGMATLTLWLTFVYANGLKNNWKD